MQSHFFATDADLLTIVRWLLETPGIRVFEPASRPDLPNRQFRSVDEVAQSFQEPGRDIGAWDEATGCPPILRHIEFNLHTQRELGAKGRTELVTPALIRIGRNSYQNGCLSYSYISSWNEKGARQRSMYSDEVLEQVNWRALRSTTERLRRSISKNSPAKFGTYPIMDHAFSELKEGKLSIWGWGAPCSYPSPEIIEA